MTTRTPKVLAEGQLANTKGTLYTVPASTTAYITSIILYQSSATPQTMILYYKPGSTSRVIHYGAAVAQYTTTRINAAGDCLQTGDLIEGETTTNAVVDYVIMGIEET